MENIRLEITLRRRNDILILDVVGEIDIYTTPQFKDAVSEAIDQGQHVVLINMSQVQYMDSSGFGTLLSATKRLRPVSGELILFGCNESISRMLQITRLNTIFGTFATEDDALASLKSAAPVASA